MAFAGIWTPWRDPATGVWLLSAAVVTTSANKPVGELHDRMPVILDAEFLDAWLDPATEPTLLQAMLAPAPAETLRRWPVSTAVNRVDADGPELLRPVEPLPSLGLA